MIIDIKKEIEDRHYGESLIPLQNGILNADLLLIKCYFGMFNQVNSWLEDSYNMNPGVPGTQFKILGFGKNGDYDFSLVSLMIIIQKYKDNLSEKAKNNLIDYLLIPKGTDLLKEFWGFSLIPETENHLLLTNISLFLTNEILYERDGKFDYNNNVNGVKDWLKHYLLNITFNGYYEYNSKPYFSWTVRGLQNLYSFSKDQEIKKLAEKLLNKTFYKYAVQNKNGNLIVPFRRRRDYLVDTIRENDEFATWFLALTGFIPDYEINCWKELNHDFNFMLTTIIQDYKPEQKFVDIALSNDKYWVKCKHSNLELTYKEKNFAIFGGGHEDTLIPLIKSSNDGIPRQTCLYLNDNSKLISDLIRFEIKFDILYFINNTGVYQNFACGLNLTIPEKFNCIKTYQKDNIIFKFFETENCYIATLYSNNLYTEYLFIDNYGCFEVVDKSEFENIQDFISKVISINQNISLTHDMLCFYRSTRGYDINFVCYTNNKDWLIKKVIKDRKIIDSVENIEKSKYLTIYHNQ